MNYLDTYALFEIGRDNPDYDSIANSEFKICDITLAEFYGVLLLEGRKNEADYFLQKLQTRSESTPLFLLIEAVQFRYGKKSLNFSFPDAVGYVHARSNGGTFVTGDKSFKKLAHVKYVK